MMLELASRAPGTRLTTRELADVCDIPPGNVPTVVSTLARAGLLMNSPGRGGGCSLARDPGTVPMLEVIEALEGSLAVDHCLLDSRRCHDKDPECALHEAWSAGRAAAISALAGTTLAAAAARELELREDAEPAATRRTKRPG